jgi:subtilisin family serine protease
MSVSALGGINIVSMEKVFKNQAPINIKKAGAEKPEATAAREGLSRIYKVRLSEGTDVKTALAKLKGDPNIEYAEPNYICKVQMLPNDPYYHSSGSWGQPYDDLWGIKKINCEKAWDISQGEGVVVAVIDTGVDYNHPDLTANIWTNPREIPNNGIDDDNNGYVDDTRGWNFVSWDGSGPNNNPMDGYGHGTHCAGIIAAVGNNNIGVIGVAPKAKIMVLKGLDDNYGSGTEADLAKCVIYAADNGAKVLSNSWGGSGESQTLTDVFHYAYSKGCVCVAAAGNSNDDVSNYHPANIDTVITVAASTQNDEKCSFSNYGKKIDVSAPGGGYENEGGQGWRDIYNIISTMLDNCAIAKEAPYLKVSDGYWRLAGTSMACPHVAGVAALILSRYPGLSNDCLRDVIRVYSDDIGYGGKDDYFGYGRLNAYEALKMSPKIRITMIDAHEVTGNNNGYIDPGDETEVVIKLMAAGADFYNVEALVTANDEFVRIENGRATFNMFNGQEVSNEANPFRLAINNNCPRGHTVELRLSIIAVDYTFSTTIPIEIHSYWPLALPYGFSSSAAAADINGDGQIEIIVGGFRVQGGFNTKLFCVDKNAHVIWEKRFNGGVFHPAPALCDVDADGRLEIICAVGYPFDTGLYCINSDGQVIWEKFFPDTLIDNFAHPIVADINGDGKDEVLFTCWYYYRTSRLLCLDGNGNELWSFYSNDWFSIPYPDSGDSVPSPAVADLDGDGRPEVLFTTARGHGWRGILIPGGDLYCINNEGKEIWHTAVGGDADSIPTIADLNNDGTPEILIAVGLPEYGYGLYCLDNIGRIIWKYNTSKDVDSTPAVADLDGDGNLEIVIDCNDGNIYCIDKDGNLLWKYKTDDWLRSSPAIADLNRDGNPEIVVSSDNNTYCIDRSGNLIWKRTTFYDFSPIIADLDGDGYPEIITGGELNCFDKDGNPFDPTKRNEPLIDGFPWPMFHHDMQHTGYYTPPSSVAPPQIISLSPASSTTKYDVYKTYTTVFSDLDGADDIEKCYMLINSALSGVNSFCGYYNRQENKLYLINNAGTGYTGGFAPGSANKIENAVSILDCKNTSVAVDGDKVTINWSVAFKPSFIGNKNVWLMVVDKLGANSGFKLMGDVNIMNTAPQPISITPNYAIINLKPTPTSTFVAKYKDEDGADDISACYLLINPTVSAVNTCDAYYDAADNKLYLVNDAGTALLGGFAPGSGNIIENSYAKLHCGGTTVTKEGKELTISWRITFKTAFVGANKHEWLYVIDKSGGNSGWRSMGALTIVYYNNAPSAYSVTPSYTITKPNMAQTFTSYFRDLDGYKDIKDGYLLINTAISAAFGCEVWYDRPNNKLYLMNDAGTAWQGGFTPGTNALIPNSYCILDCKNTAVTINGDMLIVKWRVVFKDAFIGVKNIYSYVTDTENAHDGWRRFGKVVIK